MHLAHFTKADTALEYIFKNNSIKFNSLNGVNDPRESKIWPFKFFCYQDKNKALFEEGLFERAHNYILNNFLVCCFSYDNAFPNYQECDLDMRMWAQYADNHKGLSIIFDQSKIYHSIKTFTDGDIYHGRIDYLSYPYINQKNNLTKSNFKGFIYPTVAILSHPFLNPTCTDPYMLCLEKIKSIGFEKYMNEHIKYFYNELFFTKKDSWSGEREYRFVIHTKNKEKEIFVPLEDSVKAVILGNDFEHFDKILYYARKYHFDLYKLNSRGWHSHLIKIDITDPFNYNGVSLDNTLPINFNYSTVFTQGVGEKGDIRTVMYDKNSGNFSLL
ncbi:DUF2971 domain-containing protein [Bacillus tequilensis]|uniref:DUF2971 domain-containing protein n=1 Tax=Bacillus tequilensis TaxID=227866 RepID=UPI000465BC48|nr:DUF2971 domain-containing protein [Bacillus tequilensis]MDR4434755.1 DUF2971 domain-containing protein [Bacillus tequilensis]SPT93807.1 Protein of uncharacterised function (DUF2971) [Bacillus tequilensis]SPU04715.1 Protein of uncharacterised function (DUF2971) [Bacillus tequilensis]